MLIAPTNARGFSIIAVTGALTIIGLLMMAAWPIAQDHSRRAALSADRAIAMHQAERALDAAECEIAMATGTPHPRPCVGAPDAERAAALDPITLAGFSPGQCGQSAATQALCWPLPNQPLQALSKLLAPDTNAKALDPVPDAWRASAHPPRYVIEPIPDALPGQWMHAGAARAPSLFRITAVGFGQSEKVNVMLQAIYRPQAVQP